MRLFGRFSAGFQNPHKNISRIIPPLLVISSLAVSAFVASGCGSGSGSNPSPSPSASATPTPVASASPTPSAPVVVTTRIVWGPRSRQVGTQVNAIGGPSSAQSARIVLAGANSAGGDITINANRGVLSGPQDYSSAPQQANPGVYILTATFYANADQTGAVVGTAQASVTVLPSGTISATIATVGTIQKVVVVPDAGGGFQVVGVGQTRTVAFSALDASGNVIALTPGSATVTVVPNTLADGSQDPATHITANGETVTGVFPNRATIVVTVDGVSSAPTVIVVRSNVSIAVTPPGAAGGAVTVGLGQAQTFSANVANDGPSGSSGVYWQIFNNGTLDSAQNAGTLSTSGPSTQTDFTATGALGNQTGVLRNNVPNAYVLRATSVYDPDIFVEVPITIVSLVNVTVAPNPITLSIGQTQQFVATVNLLPAGASGAVTWSVVTPGGGKITSTGTYTAPFTTSPVDSPYIIRATSKYDPTKFVDVAVTVVSLIKVTVVPNPVTLSINQTQQFAATVSLAPPNATLTVTWSVVTPGGGSITSTGLYTAPSTPSAPGTPYIIRATSDYDPTKFQDVPVTVQSGSLPIVVN